ncbi:ribosome silencing factor [Crocosphaera sp. XPORK-15E]|uniref:ribosome silencing factor n=1 Tax=Crocosphaera sp. XPORK-15E TaxID=3110247 RepID=UPI002B203528|nr:ribosome silencing factor [Crocosphaera sp. XPORK-15E]MEA5533899.1 ribosome silencing factor [Crocosphaera sp. XPORK-15E]
MTNYEQLTPNPSTTVIDNASDPETQALATMIAQAADDRKADNIVLLKVGNVSYLADYFVIITGFSSTQVKAIAEAIEHQVAQTYNRLPLRTEGKREGNWVLQDFGEVIVHIFLPEEREFYNLEAFWGHAERLEFSSEEVTRL